MRSMYSGDVPSELFKNRIIMLTGEVCDEMANEIVPQLLVMDNDDNTKPIHIYINSPGGACTAGLAILDTMNTIKSPVYTYCVGLAASMGAALLSAGEKGHRYALKNASIMIHQVSSGTHGNIQDQRVSLQYSEKLNERLMKLIAENCGKSYESLLVDTVRDKWMFSEEAKEYGIIDEVIDSTSAIGGSNA